MLANEKWKTKHVFVCLIHYIPSAGSDLALAGFSSDTVARQTPVICSEWQSSRRQANPTFLPPSLTPLSNGASLTAYLPGSAPVLRIQSPTLTRYATQQMVEDG